MREPPRDGKATISSAGKDLEVTRLSAGMRASGFSSLDLVPSSDGSESGDAHITVTRVDVLCIGKVICVQYRDTRKMVVQVGRRSG